LPIHLTLAYALVAFAGIFHFAIASASPAAAAKAAEMSARRIVSLVEYIGGDYPEAVQQGRIVSKEEFKEMHDFADAAARELEKIAPLLTEQAARDSRANLASIKRLIGEKADVSAIRALTRSVKDLVITSQKIATAPKTKPDRALASAVYARDCASCHGAVGNGDGPAAAGMEPRPRNFHDDGVMAVSSPFKFYNTMKLGVEGTTMPSFDGILSEQELWNLAFYAMAFRHGIPGAAEQDPVKAWQSLPEKRRKALIGAGLALPLLASASDDELAQWLTVNAGLTKEDAAQTLGLLRTAAPFMDGLPGESAPVGSASGAAPLVR